MSSNSDRCLRRYLARGAPVEGWLTPYSGRFIASLSAAQRRLGITGALGEIGVHHGRLFIVLKLTADPGEKLFAVDLFAAQHLNVDQSGHGDEAMFLKNLRRWTGGDNVELIRGSSLDVSPPDITRRVGPCRLISVDGGHTEECTLNDLRLAQSVLLDQGVIVLDDMFKEGWPGVMSGAMRYLADAASTHKIFAITPNKTYWSRPAFHDLYRAEMRRLQGDHYRRSAHFAGYEVDVFTRRPVVRRSVFDFILYRAK